MPPAISDEETSEAEMPSTMTPKSAREKKPVKYAEPTLDALEDDEEMVDDKEEETNGKVADEEEDDDEDEEEETNGKVADEEEDDDEDEEGGEDGEEPEEYVVETILSHRFEKGVLKFEVKWEGYEKKSDRTWEPEENLETASAVLEEYYSKIGGREKIFEDAANGLKNKKRGRPQADTPTSSAKRSRKNGSHPADTSPPATARQAAWKPPAGSWEDEIADLDACEDEESGRLMVYLTWKNGNKTQHETSVIYKRCPQKMLHFYEQHVRIIKKDSDEAPGDSPDM